MSKTPKKSALVPTKNPKGDVAAYDFTTDVSLASADPSSPIKVTMVYLEAELKDKFEKYLNENIDLKTSKMMSEEEWLKRIYVLQRWDSQQTEHQGKILSQPEFRRNYREGYRWCQQFRVDTNSSGVSQLWKLGKPSNDDATSGDKLVVHTGMIFDIVKEAHVEEGSHLKCDRVWNSLKDRYSNIPRTIIKKYCDLCPICCGKQPVIKPYKGAKKPIRSWNFRDRMQVDLIDYRLDPQKWNPEDSEGPTYRWLMVVKDHFSRFLIGAPLEAKSANAVARELHKIYAIVGYPLIQHTDNGSEFKNEQVLECLRQLNPCCFSVQGRPRKPNVQGSVEQSNGAIKAAIAACVQEERNRGSQHTS